MRGRSAPEDLLALGCAVAFCLSLAGCDQVDVTSSVEPPSARCASCHLPEYLDTTHPPHVGVKPTTCGTCHSQTSFHPAELVHSFPLEGAHRSADCFACHRGVAPIFEGTPKACATCHGTERAKADATVLHHSNFADACANCHGTTAWKPTLHADAAATPELVPSAASKVAAPIPASRPTANAAPRVLTPSIPTSPPEPATPVPTAARRKPDTVSGASRHQR